jgi:hypothetical protein
LNTSRFFIYKKYLLDIIDIIFFSCFLKKATPLHFVSLSLERQGRDKILTMAVSATAGDGNIGVPVGNNATGNGGKRAESHPATKNRTTLSHRFRR